MTDIEDEEVIQNAVATSKNVKLRRVLFVLGCIFVLSAVVIGTAAGSAYLALKGTATDATVLAQQIERECALKQVDPDLAQFCQPASKVVEAAPADVKSTPIPGPPGPSGSPGAQGEPGDPPTDAQVQVAVTSFCTSTGSCRGQDGADATPAQVAIAVSSYCDNRGQCRGPEGAAGTNGLNGTNGTNGKDAPPITQDQLVAAVDSYCSSVNNCRGPAGVDGKDGATGEQGPAGPTGVVGVRDDCGPAPDGQVIADVTPDYDPDTQTVIISCTYRDDEVGGVLQNRSEQ